MTMLIRLRDSYLTANADVKLSVTIGEGQRGFIEVLMNGAVLASGNGITKLSIGAGPNVAGNRLRVSSTVTDTNEMTNRTSVMYELEGGARDQSWVSEHTIDADGGSVDYDASFLLI
jgi:hypothetical protein